jgi:hypothetical protein
MDADELEAYVTVVKFLMNGSDIGVYDCRANSKEFKPLARAADRRLCHRRSLGLEWARFFLPNRAKIEKYMQTVAIQEAK